MVLRFVFDSQVERLHNVSPSGYTAFSKFTKNTACSFESTIKLFLTVYI